MAVMTPPETAVKVKVLLVDDRTEELMAMKAVLDNLAAEIHTARSGREALRALLKHEYAVVVLDVNMPDMDGFETAALIRKRKRSQYTPIIFITAAMATETHISEGYVLGAVDYIQRPVLSEVLRAKIGVFVELHKRNEELRRKEQEDAERRLRETNERLDAETKRNLFFVLSLDLLAIIDLEGCFRQLNPAWQKTLGFSEEELKSEPLLERVHPDDRLDTARHLRALAEGATLAHFENRFLCCDGSYRSMEWVAAPLTDQGLVYVVAHDVTERKQSERDQALLLELEQERAARFHRLASASIAIGRARPIDEILTVVSDQARETIRAHQAMVRVEVEPGKFLGAVSQSSKYPFWRGDDPQISILDDLLRGVELPARFTADCIASDARWSPWREVQPHTFPGNGCLAVPLLQSDGRQLGFILVCDKLDGDFTSEDESILVQLSRMASLAVENALSAGAREANRLKDEFLATLSHELRTPLSVILGWTWTLRKGSPDEMMMHEAIETIDRNGKILSKLIEDLLDISRIISGKMRLRIQDVSLRAAAEQAVASLQPLALERGVVLRTSYDPRVGVIQGDPDRLQQVIWNLISNAIKFTPAGGEVELRVDLDSSNLRIVVTDSGQGIAPEFLPYVFDRFRQSESSSTRKHGGLGLGLAIVNRLVELHGGRATAESEGEGKGAKFTVELPLTAHPPAVEAITTELPAGAPSLDGVHVLVVDDEADSRSIVATLLRQCGAEVVTAGSSNEALEALQSAASQLDVVLSDISMPGEDGYAFIRRMRELDGHAQLPVIALTAHAREEDRVSALAAGFKSHLAKPVDPERLAREVARVVGRV